MPQMSHVPGWLLTTSGCMGQIHLPASDASSTRPPPVMRLCTTARTNMPGFRRMSALGTFTRTFTVRVFSLSTGSMKAMRPRKTWPGSLSVVNSTSCP